MAERLTGYQRRECEQVVSDLLEEPGDLWDIGGADLTAFYNEDGTLDEADCVPLPAHCATCDPSWRNHKARGG